MWRGPRGDGLSHESEAPLNWSSTENIAWRVEVPGSGRSSPVIQSNGVYLTTFTESDRARRLLRYDRKTGHLDWDTVIHLGDVENQHKFNTSASATPVCDEKRVYCTFVDSERMIVAAVDHSGEVVWKTSPGSYFSKHGFAASPALCEEGLIINGHQDGSAFVVMLDPKSGEERWRYRPETDLRSFSTPLVIESHGKRQIVLAGAKQTLALDPGSGNKIWSVDGPTEKVVCTPSFGLGHVFSFGGSPDTRAIAIALRSAGGPIQSEIVWTKERAMRLAEAIRQAVEDYPFANRGQQPLGAVTVSGGVATFPEDSEKAEHLLRAADHALYEAKAEGRNRIVPAEPNFIA